MAISDLRFGSPGAKSLSAFEEYLGYELPGDYRLFLESSNGGCLNPNACMISSVEDLVILDVLFGVGLVQDFDLRFWREAYLSELPANILVIGGDPYGNLFLLGLEESQIYLWDHIRRLKKSSDVGNAYLIAGNFTNFVGMLDKQVAEILGTVGPKMLQNIWHDSGNKNMQEISRVKFTEFSRMDGFSPIRL